MKIYDGVIEYNMKGKTVIVNPINGAVISLDKEHYDIYRDMKEKGLADSSDKMWGEMLSFLLKNQFVVNSDNELNETKKRIVDRILKENARKRVTQIAFVLSYNCNFRCPYCYERYSARGADARIISKEMVDAALELHKDGVKGITLFGGEPLLEENRAIIEYIVQKNKDCEFSILTNGYLLEEYYDVFSRVRIGIVQVTLDGKTDRHNKTRVHKNGTATFDKIMHGVELYLKSGIPIKFRMNITKDNLSECLELRTDILRKYDRQRNIMSFEMYPVFQLSDSEKTKILAQIYSSDFKESRNNPDMDKTNINHILGTALPIANFFALGKKPTPIVSYCDAHTTRRYYDPYGDIYSCILAVGDKNATEGKYYPEVKLNPKGILCRNITTIKECRNCGYSLMCGGGCPYELIKKGIGVQNPNCANFIHCIKEEIPALLAAQL